MASAMETAAEPPREFVKHTRACFRCKLVKTFEQVRLARRHPSLHFPRSRAPTHRLTPPPASPPDPATHSSSRAVATTAHFNMADDRDRVAEGTTTSYSGIVSVIDPKGSGAAKRLRLEVLVLGCYALELNDEVPEAVAQEIEERMEMGDRRVAGARESTLSIRLLLERL